jgi:CxxC motif-containing protein (DUF1111 family)
MAAVEMTIPVTCKPKKSPMKTATAVLGAALNLPTVVLAATPPPPSLPPRPPAVAAPALPAQPPGRAIAAAGPHGKALAGLSVKDQADFAEGLVEFLNVETPEGGLGPIFNDVSCVACHFQGGVGGGSRTVVTRFGRVTNGVFDPLTNLGGPLLQRRAIDPIYLETVPAEANVVARRITTPVFGAGLIEAIPDASITALAALVKPDGVKGRVSLVKDEVSGTMRVGRFGWKAQVATLATFSADAYLNEMGVTGRYFPVENAPNGNTELLKRGDKVLDPEDALAAGASKSDSDLAADFMRLLAPVPPLAGASATTPGAAVFRELGCAVCHVPSQKTGPGPIAALANKSVGLYSDLLLHDMGRLGDGIAQPPATMTEMRTAPLWGLRLRDRYLHDGRASTLDLAILAHDGEAKVARDRYSKLTPAKRSALMAFLAAL